MKLVVIESPYAAKTHEERRLNDEYLISVMRDSLRRGEAPLASALLYATSGVLDDDISEDRRLGIEAGLAWGEKADVTVVYFDRGVSLGMKLGIERAHKHGRAVEFRSLEGRTFVDVKP